MNNQEDGSSKKEKFNQKLSRLTQWIESFFKRHKIKCLMRFHRKRTFDGSPIVFTRREIQIKKLFSKQMYCSNLNIFRRRGRGGAGRKIGNRWASRSRTGLLGKLKQLKKVSSTFTCPAPTRTNGLSPKTRPAKRSQHSSKNG